MGLISIVCSSGVNLGVYKAGVWGGGVHRRNRNILNKDKAPLARTASWLYAAGSLKSTPETSAASSLGVPFPVICS